MTSLARWSLLSLLLALPARGDDPALFRLPPRFVPAPAPGPLLAWPGEFVLATLTGNYVTAVGGGGRITDVLHTDATQVGSWEKFRLFYDPATREVAFQTLTGNFVTAVGGGGRTTDVLHTDATQVNAWERFHLWSQSGDWYAIQTVSTNYLTALGGGGHLDPAFHTDAVRPYGWEFFHLWKVGDVGTGYGYRLLGPSGSYLYATGGGGATFDAVRPDPGGWPLEWSTFRLVRQDDGTYGLQTPSGNWVTAVGGGGQPAGSDVLHTDATVVRAWEKFRLVDQGDGTYAIQTVTGHFLGAWPGLSTDSSGVSIWNRFRLNPSGL